MSAEKHNPVRKPLTARKAEAAREVAAKIDSMATEVTPKQEEIIKAYVRGKSRKPMARA